MSQSRRQDWFAVLARGVTTPRLTLRLLALGDHAVWAGGYRGRGPASYSYDEGPPAEQKLDADRFGALVERQLKVAIADRAYVLWAFGLTAGDAIGAVDLGTYERGAVQWANLGFWIHNQHHGKGYAVELIRAGISIGLTTLGYHRLEAAIRPDNRPAVAAAAAAGMEREGIRRRFWLDPDGWADHVIYAAIAD